MPLTKFKKVSNIIIFISIIQIFLLSFAFAADYSALPGSSGDLKMLEPGQKAVDFIIKTMDDEDYKLSAVFGKKTVLLLFWSIFCQPCQEEIPVIKELYEKVGKDNLVVIAVSLDGDKRIPAIRSYIEKNKLDFVFVMDVFDEEKNQYIASDTYGVLGTPTFFIIDKNGTITHNHTGKSTIDELLKRVSEAKSGS